MVKNVQWTYFWGQEILRFSYIIYKNILECLPRRIESYLSELDANNISKHESINSNLFHINSIYELYQGSNNLRKFTKMTTIVPQILAITDPAPTSSEIRDYDDFGTMLFQTSFKMQFYTNFTTILVDLI